jgi:hypothetical protein
MLTGRMYPVEIQYLECNRYVDKVMELVDELHISQVLTLLCFTGTKVPAVLVQEYKYVKSGSPSTSSTSARYSLYFALLVQKYQLYWYKSTNT